MREVSLTDALDAKEKKFATQKSLLKTFGTTLVCFCVNYVGKIKKDAYTEIIFKEGAHAFDEAFVSKTVFKRFDFCFTGDTAYFCVDADAKEVKLALCEVEKNHPLGRLFDFDVFDQAGNGVDRQSVGLPQRKCLLCDRDARECYILRSHPTEQLKQKIIDTVDAFCRRSTKGEPNVF